MYLTLKADQRGDLDGAAELLRRAVDIEPEHDEALGYLAEIEERRGDFVGAADVLRAHLEARAEARRAPVHARLGALLREHFQDLEGARAQYEAVLELEPEHEPAMLALLDIARAEQRWVDVHRLAVRVAEVTEDARLAGERWARAGQVAQERLGDDRRAIEAFERTVEVDPEDLATRARLGELYLGRQAPDQAHPHLWAAAQGLSDPVRSADLALAAGRAAEQAEDREAARTAYAAVLERVPASREALERMSAIYDEEQAHDRAYDLAANLILHHEPRLGPKERAQVYLRMARARWGQGKSEDAHRLAKQSHHLDPTVEAPLRIMADALERAEDPFEAAECLKRLAHLVETDEDKTAALLRAGRMLQEEAEDPARAAAMLTEAQDVAPADEEVGQRLAVCRNDIGDPSGAADALCALAEHRSGRVKADRLVQAARVLLGAAEDRSRARGLLQDALSVVPTHLGARRDLEVVLEFDQDLEALAGHYVSWADALAEGSPSEADLDGRPVAEVRRARLEAAIEVYRDRLEDPGRALESVRRLIESEGPEAWQELYARLLDAMLEATPTEADNLAWEAIRAWSKLVEDRPGRVEGLRRLYTLRTQVGETHLARIAAELSDALGAPLGVNGMGPLPELDADRAHPAEVPVDPSEASDLGRLLEAVGYAAVKAMQDVLPAARPKKKELVGPAGLGISVSRPLEVAARLLGVEVPPVYVRNEAPQAIVPTLAGDTPALVVSLDRANGQAEAVLRFLFGRALSLLRPRALPLAVLPLDALREALVGFGAVADAEDHFVDVKNAKKRGRALDRALPADRRAELAVQVGTWLGTGDRRSLGAERQAVFRTAERMGLVASGSLTVSLETLSALSGGRYERDWRMPLIRFAATRAYAEIMRRRG